MLPASVPITGFGAQQPYYLTTASCSPVAGVCPSSRFVLHLPGTSKRRRIREASQRWVGQIPIRESER